MALCVTGFGEISVFSEYAKLIGNVLRTNHIRHDDDDSGCTSSVALCNPKHPQKNIHVHNKRATATYPCGIVIAMTSGVTKRDQGVRSRDGPRVLRAYRGSVVFIKF